MIKTLICWLIGCSPNDHMICRRCGRDEVGKVSGKAFHGHAVRRAVRWVVWRIAPPPSPW
jgi:hypothetical protein